MSKRTVEQLREKTRICAECSSACKAEFPSNKNGSLARICSSFASRAKSAESRVRELEAMVADRGRERDAAQEAAGSAERRLRELEAQSAAMRGTLTSLAAWLEAGAPVDDMLEVEEWRSVCVSALSSDAGRALLERADALERDLAEKSERCARGAHALIAFIGAPGPEHIDETCARASRRIEALERVADEVRASIVRPESALGEAMAALDALEPKR